MKNIFNIILLTFGVTLMAQVGIGTTTPQATLDVNGNFEIHDNGKLYLENPGLYNNQGSSSLMLVKDLNDNTLKKFDPESLPFSSVSFTTYFFDNVDEKGLVSYDTKINGDRFHVCIGGYRVLRHDQNTSITLTGSTGSDNSTINYLPLYNARAYVNPTTNTWILTFQPNSGREFESNIDLYLNVSIYFKNFLTKANTPIIVNMNGVNTGNGNAPAPVGAMP
jgi:hypothetical protein